MIFEQKMLTKLRVKMLQYCSTDYFITDIKCDASRKHYKTKYFLIG